MQILIKLFEWESRKKSRWKRSKWRKEQEKKREIIIIKSSIHLELMWIFQSKYAGFVKRFVASIFAVRNVRLHTSGTGWYNVNRKLRICHRFVDDYMEKRESAVATVKTKKKTRTHWTCFSTSLTRPINTKNGLIRDSFYSSFSFSPHVSVSYGGTQF